MSRSVLAAFGRLLVPEALFRRTPATALFLFYLALLPVYCLARVGEAKAMVWWLTLAIPSVLCLSMLAHAALARGRRRAAALFGSAAAITLAAEALGASTGVPFGSYSYTGTLGPQAFGLVPWLIPVAWCGMLYPAWAVGGAITRRPALRVAVAALAMTAWDLSLDPRMVAEGHWVWRTPGPYFGIPLENFVGWAVTAALVFVVWTALERGAAPAEAGVPLPTAAYAMVWLGEAIANALFWAGPLVGLCVFAGMGAFVAAAAVRLSRAA